MEKKSKTIENKDLIASMMYMKENKLIQPSKSTPYFETVSEAENAAKEDIAFAVKERVNTLKQEISELQKKGYELHLESIKLLEIPLKINLWKANLLRKDLEHMYEMIHSVMDVVEEFQKEESKKVPKEE